MNMFGYESYSLIIDRLLWWLSHCGSLLGHHTLSQTTLVFLKVLRSAPWLPSGALFLPKLMQSTIPLSMESGKMLRFPQKRGQWKGCQLFLPQDMSWDDGKMKTECFLYKFHLEERDIWRKMKPNIQHCSYAACVYTEIAFISINY